MKRDLSYTFTAYLVLFVLIVFNLSHIIYMIILSFKPNAEILRGGFLPEQPTLEGFISVFTRWHMAQNFVNSLIIASLTCIIAILAGIFGAYLLGRLNFPGKFIFVIAIIVGFSYPSAAILVSVYINLTALGLYGSYIGQVIAICSYELPYVIWILKDFFTRLPKNIEEAAMVDGCTHLGAFLRVVLPISRPAIGAIAVLSFLSGWRNFMFTSILSTPKTMPVAPKLYHMIVLGLNDYSGMMAATLLGSIPTILIYVALQKYVVAGLRS